MFKNTVNFNEHVKPLLYKRNWGSLDALLHGNLLILQKRVQALRQ